MVLIVVVTVVILAFVVSGYWVNSKFEVERQGLLQVSSVPTGAFVRIDDEEASWLSVTNTSKILSSGEHVVELSKEGYDSWSKTINISDGLLYRLHYPRLFLIDRTSEPILDIGTASTMMVSPDHNWAVLANNTSKWTLLELDSESLQQSEMDISGLFSEIHVEEGAEAGLFEGEIVGTDWSSDSEHLLLKINMADAISWVIIDTRHPERSLNLTKEFAADFDNVKIMDRSANTLLVMRNHNLHRVDLISKSVSSVLVQNVFDYDYYNNTVIFSALAEQESTADSEYYVGELSIGDTEIKEISRSQTPTLVAVSKFYDDTYVTTLQGNQLVVYRANQKGYGQYLYEDLSFLPTKMETGHHGEFILLSNENHLATLDMESSMVREWEVESNHFGWLDNDMLYCVYGSGLIVYDYDGFNRRELLSNNVSSHFPVAITDDKWLYYVSDGNLIREWLIEH